MSCSYRLSSSLQDWDSSQIIWRMYGPKLRNQSLYHAIWLFKTDWDAQSWNLTCHQIQLVLNILGVLCIPSITQLCLVSWKSKYQRLVSDDSAQKDCMRVCISSRRKYMNFYHFCDSFHLYTQRPCMSSRYRNAAKLKVKSTQVIIWTGLFETFLMLTVKFKICVVRAGP